MGGGKPKKKKQRGCRILYFSEKRLHRRPKLSPRPLLLRGSAAPAENRGGTAHPRSPPPPLPPPQLARGTPAPPGPPEPPRISAHLRAHSAAASGDRGTSRGFLRAAERPEQKRWRLKTLRRVRKKIEIYVYIKKKIYI